MREVQILHQMLAQQCPQIHKKRLSSLIVATQSLFDGDRLSLTELGRSIEGRVAPKHNIKRMVRLLGIHHLNNERLAIYRWHAQQIGWHRHFQANTIRKRAVLSVVRLGKEVRRRPDFVISEQRIQWAINEFVRLVHTAGLKDL
ncbi:hypothetical protein EZV61_19060 [Corallincola luteus]|uniref:Uncharacterized protein n=1 Tax=Corallincola luteus TaxID=1775177 RepID=A0ABY2AHT2_9GAMM|nr:hypothetical protein EZV61_19060 [Corallincola luteus]